MRKHYLITPINKKKLKNIIAGDIIYLSGYIYTARDATHNQLLKIINTNKKIPINLNEIVIYYSGPTPKRPGNIIGSIGPTTSSRMDKYTPKLLKKGISIIIGKGKRNKNVIKNLIKTQSIYCVTYGGAGALLASKIMESKLIAFKNLGTEGMYRLKVKNFPIIVINDIIGNDWYNILHERRIKNEK